MANADEQVLIMFFSLSVSAVQPFLNGKASIQPFPHLCSTASKDSSALHLVLYVYFSPFLQGCNCCLICGLRGLNILQGTCQIFKSTDTETKRCTRLTSPTSREVRAPNELYYFQQLKYSQESALVDVCTLCAIGNTREDITHA